MPSKVSSVLKCSVGMEQSFLLLPHTTNDLAFLLSAKAAMLVYFQILPNIKKNASKERLMSHVFNPSTREAEAGGFLSLRPAWSTK